MGDEAGASDEGPLDGSPGDGREGGLGGASVEARAAPPTRHRRRRTVAIGAGLVVALAGAGVGVVVSGGVSPGAVDLPLASGTAQVTWGTGAIAAGPETLLGPVDFSGRLSGHRLTGTLRWSRSWSELMGAVLAPAPGSGPATALPDRVRMLDISGRVGTTRLDVSLSWRATAAERSELRALQAGFRAAEQDVPSGGRGLRPGASVPSPDPFSLPSLGPLSGSVLGPPLGTVGARAAAPSVYEVSGRFGAMRVTGTLTSAGPDVHARFELHVGPYAVSGTFADVTGSTNRATATYAVS